MTAVPDAVSVTVTLHVDPWLITTVVVHVTVVEVDLSGIEVTEIKDDPVLVR